MEDENIEKEIASIMAYKRLFSSPDGKVVLDHLKMIGCYATSTVVQEEIRDLTLWREGRRSIVLDILSAVDRDVEKYRKHIMQQRKLEDEYDSFS